MAGQKKKLSFEDALGKLEQSAEMLKKDGVTLEEALKNFEEGVENYQYCSGLLQQAKQKIEQYDKELNQTKEMA